MDQVRDHNARKDPNYNCRNRQKRNHPTEWKMKRVDNESPAKKLRQTSDTSNVSRKKCKRNQQKNKERQFCRDYHYRGFCAFGPLCRYSHTAMDLSPDVDWHSMFTHGKSDTPDREDVYLSYFFMRSETIPSSDHRLPIFQTFCSNTTEEDTS